MMDTSEAERRWTAANQMAFWTATAVILIDGYDTLVLGYAAPAIGKELAIGLGQFGLIFSVGLLGAVTGAAVLGPLADRHGRRPVLLISIALFALFTYATTFGRDLATLAVLRFCTGIGLGGAVPCAIALAAAHIPSKRRQSALQSLWAAFPGGGVLGGVAASTLATHGDWRVLFLIGAVTPIALLPFVFFVQETKAVQCARDPVDILGSLPRKTLSSLLVPERRIVTIGIWTTIFLLFLAVITIPLWAPTLLQLGGWSERLAPVMVGLFNLSSVIGMLLLRRLAPGPRGVRQLQLLVGAGAIASLGIAANFENFAINAVLFALAGLTIGGAAGSIVSLTAQTYPDRIRATGLGAAMAIGRLGQVIGPAIFGALLASGSGGVAVFVVLAGIVASAALSLILLREE
jgi:AAHS family 4-hydroxybenzoate transporter-like MFS transporter